MGNENIYMLTNNEDYALRIELEDFEGNKRSVLLALKHKMNQLLTILLSYFLLESDMHNIHTLKFIRKLITINLRLMDMKEMLAIL